MTIVLIIWIVLLVISGIAGTIVGIHQCKDSTASSTKDDLDDINNVAPMEECENVNLPKSDMHCKPIAASDDKTNKAGTGKKVNKIYKSGNTIKAPIECGKRFGSLYGKSYTARNKENTFNVRKVSKKRKNIA